MRFGKGGFDGGGGGGMMPNQMVMALKATPKGHAQDCSLCRGNERNATKREGNGHGTHANESPG